MNLGEGYAGMHSIVPETLLQNYFFNSYRKKAYKDHIVKLIDFKGYRLRNLSKVTQNVH